MAKHLEEIEEEEMPLVLATLGLCVREGVSEPEIAVLRINRDQIDSRQGLLALWNRIRPSFLHGMNLKNLVGLASAFPLRALKQQIVLSHSSSGMGTIPVQRVRKM
jgi:hypothetical protein